MTQGPVWDVAIVGGGIVGLATAMTLSARHPSKKFLLFEKEAEVGQHQTGHNSGVIHSGLYYRPGSLKARLCREGAEALFAFCEKHAIPCHRCGKVVAATRDDEVPLLEKLYERGRQNGLKRIEWIGPERLREIEPHAFSIKAIRVPEAGIVDFTKVAKAYADLAAREGADIRMSARVQSLTWRTSEWILRTTAGDFRSKDLVNCGGLYSDRIAKAAGASREVAIIPFRGSIMNSFPNAPLS